MLNARGSDIDFNPVFFSYVIVTNESLYLFIDDKKVTSVLRKHFQNENVNVTFYPYEKIQSFYPDLVSICFVDNNFRIAPSCISSNLSVNIEQVKSEIAKEGKVWIDPTSSFAFTQQVQEKQLLLEASPIAAMKAIKNEVEIEGIYIFKNSLKFSRSIVQSVGIK